MPDAPDWFEKAMQDPADCYRKPGEIVVDDRLTAEQKRKVLEAWKLDADRLSESESEGMGGGVRPHVDEVEKALLALDKGSG
jgi:hypothetical protein